MPTSDEIISGLQFSMPLLTAPPNSSDQPVYGFSYQFETTQPADLGHGYTGWTALTGAERATLRASFERIESVLNLSFTEVSGVADPDLNLGKVDMSGNTIGLGGYSYGVSGSGRLTDYDGFALFSNALNLASNRMSLILHEFGHMLGLKHSFASDGANGPLDPAYDSLKYTVMSYTNNPDTNAQSGGFALFDIVALQDRWGANTSTNSGDDSYSGPRVSGVDVIWDTGGSDTLDASARSTGVVLDLNAGAFSRFGDYEDVAIAYGVSLENAIGGSGNDSLTGNASDNSLSGGTGNDTLRGAAGDDTLYGGDGSDTLDGGAGDDFIFGGTSAADLRDVIYGGDGNDRIDGGYGNDLIYGMNDNDTIAGGFGADTLQGQDGDDVITGSALSDLVFGGAGDDFLNGGFGHDRLNGGAGADKFYHLGIADHGSDWIQDYNAAEGDVLLFGDPNIVADDFQVNFTHTASPEGERSGDDDVTEAFVIYKPTEQIIWALVDGGGQAQINLKIGADIFDLLA
jgi:serralysin